MARVKYNGTIKRRITWSSMGKCYSYNVNPGEVLSIPEDQVKHACGCGPFTVISSLTQNVKGATKVNKKVIKKEEPEEVVVKVVKPVPVVEEPVVEEPVVEEPEVEEVVEEEVDTEAETKELPPIAEEVVEEETEEVVESIDYTSIRKAGLKDMCKERDLLTRGNRDDLIARLVAYDKGIVLDK